MMAKFGEKSGNDTRAKLFSNNRDYLAEIKNISGRYKIENAGINTNILIMGLPTWALK
ncbi:hypothetical protein [Flavobacterium sp. N1994]|uniref:hypothetical protein n=1 Tax=Flavobacterium sp. N1994 TaxID=2986827 RepID=UPI002222A7C6|nr:hypothetical protein [Flavobacterium sp. N1994]